MPSASELWEYFHKGTTRYKTNKTNWNTWCRACIRLRTCELLDAETAAYNRGSVEKVRTEEEVQSYGELLQVFPRRHRLTA